MKFTATQTGKLSGPGFTARCVLGKGGVVTASQKREGDGASPAGVWLYNRPVSLPFAASHEKLWRDDHVYDVIVELGYNDDPVEPGRGSAIFMHVARPNFEPTEGCVALEREDLLALLEMMLPDTEIEISF